MFVLQFINIEISLITTKGQVVVPARLRKKYGIKSGKKIAFFEENGAIVLKPVYKSFFKQYAGILNDTVPTKEEYQAWKKEDIEKEEYKLAK
ncbi:MAG: AbrB/MazE/SpoVT family DNA-binding domain-containing protein [Sphingobacteriaceae bacterium]|nr:MAG: AbrB/MazE/SpoVT family DNA-binding domain-containing protein [Sphingobacteriaceae bacterium]